MQADRPVATDVDLSVQLHVQSRRNAVRNRHVSIRDPLPQPGGLGSAGGRNGAQQGRISPDRAGAAASHTHLGKVGDNHLGRIHSLAESVDLGPGKTMISRDEQVWIGPVCQRTQQLPGADDRAERGGNGRMAAWCARRGCAMCDEGSHSDQRDSHQRDSHQQHGRATDDNRWRPVHPAAGQQHDCAASGSLSPSVDRSGSSVRQGVIRRARNGRPMCKSARQ